MRTYEDEHVANTWSLASYVLNQFLHLNSSSFFQLHLRPETAVTWELGHVFHIYICYA